MSLSPRYFTAAIETERARRERQERVEAACALLAARHGRGQ